MRAVLRVRDTSGAIPTGRIQAMATTRTTGTMPMPVTPTVPRTTIAGGGTRLRRANPRPRAAPG